MFDILTFSGPPTGLVSSLGPPLNCVINACLLCFHVAVKGPTKVCKWQKHLIQDTLLELPEKVETSEKSWCQSSTGDKSPLADLLDDISASACTFWALLTYKPFRTKTMSKYHNGSFHTSNIDLDGYYREKTQRSCVLLQNQLRGLFSNDIILGVFYWRQCGLS